MTPIERYLPPLSENAARWARFLAVVAGAAFFVWLCLALKDVLTPMVAGFAIAYILNPAVTWLETRRRISRIASVSVGLATLLLTTGVLLFAGAVQLVEFIGNVPAYLEATDRWMRQSFPILYTEAPALPNGADSSTPQTPAKPAPASPLPPSDAIALPDESEPVAARRLRPNVRSWLQDVALNAAKASPGYANTMIARVFYWGSVAVLLPMYTFFFLLHFNTVIRAIREHLPDRYRDTIVRIVTTIDRSIANFFRGRLIVCCIVGATIAVGWTIVGVPYPLPLGALAGLLNLIPFMSILALPPALILAYSRAAAHDEGWLWPVVLTMGVYMAAQALESFVLSPLVESRASGIHPVTTVVVLLIGNQAAGLLGMLLAIPIASTLKSLAIEYALPEVRRLAAAARASGDRPPPESGTAPPAQASPASAPEGKTPPVSP